MGASCGFWVAGSTGAGTGRSSFRATWSCARLGIPPSGFAPGIACGFPRSSKSLFWALRGCR